jgi:hypothetical protein
VTLAEESGSPKQRWIGDSIDFGLMSQTPITWASESDDGVLEGRITMLCDLRLLLKSLIKKDTSNSKAGTWQSPGVAVILVRDLLHDATVYCFGGVTVGLGGCSILMLMLYSQEI